MAGQYAGRVVKIAVIGDSQVGKTSLVIALTNESFPDICPPVVPPASMPAESSPEGVPFHVIDTSSRPEQRTAFEQTCITADAIILLFEAGSRKSIKRVKDYWMPLLKTLGVHVPVILVASKLDLAENTNDSLTEIAKSIVLEFQQLEVCLECSAKQLRYVSDVFLHALKACLNPALPLFNPQAEQGQGAFTPLFCKAFKRIFIINDVDKDGVISESELQNFQMSVFSTPLRPEEVSGIMKVVGDQMQQGVTQGGLTLSGFLYLIALFYEKGRLETVWAMLRTYGYNNDLRLSDEMLSEVNFTHAPDQVVEMTELCQQFFTRIFHDFDKDKDQLLNQSEQLEMFSTAPQEAWQGDEYESLLVSGQGQGDAALTLQGFLSKWAFTTAINPVDTLAYLRYLGYRGSAASFFTISKSRKQERKQEQIQRSVLQALVFLGKGAGQGLLLRGVAGQQECTDPATADGKSCAAGQIEYEGSAKTLILHEQDRQAVSQIERDPESLSTIDAAAFAFDSSSVDSFREAHDMLLRCAHASGNSMPCVLVAVESGKGMQEAVIRECAMTCAALRMRQPLTLYSDNLADVNDIFTALLQAAEKPEKSLAIPLTPSLKAIRRQQDNLKRTAIYALGGLGVGLLCYATYKAVQSLQSSESSRVEPSVQSPSNTPPVSVE